MRLSITLPGLAIAVAALSTAALASAAGGHHKKGHADPEEKGHHAESEYPVAYGERPMTLPRFGLAPELEADVSHITGASKVEAGMNLGAAFGITKDLEVGAFFVPLVFSPEFTYGSVEAVATNLQFFGTYRFFHTHSVELGGRLRAYVLAPHTGMKAGTVLQPGVPILLHLGSVGRLDAELALPIAINGVSGEGTHLTQDFHVGLTVPITLVFDLGEHAHVGLRTGVDMADFRHAGERMTVPLGFVAGFAIGGHKPILDIDPYFLWSDFLTPGVGKGGDKINPGNWTVGLGLRGFIYL